MEGRVQQLLLPREEPPMLDIGAIEDDARLNAIVGDSISGRTTPRLGSEGGSPALHSDDSALASLVAPRAQTPHLVRPNVGDDIKLTALMGPSQAEEDDLALADELSRPFDKAEEVLGKISRLRAEREQNEKDLEILQEIMGPPTPRKEEKPLVVQRTRKIPVMNLKYQSLERGSLCYFAAIGDLSTVQYLLDQARRCGDFFFVNSMERGRTALHFACHQGSIEVVEALLEAGADTMFLDAQDRMPLHIASSRGQVEVARLLVGTSIYRLRAAAWSRFQELRLQPTAPWEDAQVAAQRAAQQSMAEYLRALEDLRRSFLLTEDKHQFTCLHYAIRDAYAGCFAILRLLLTSCCEFLEGQQMNDVMQNKRFQQPQPGLVANLSSQLLEKEVACQRREHLRRSKVVRIEACNHRDIEGFTPLHYAASEGNYRAAQVLLAHGADPEAVVDVPDVKEKSLESKITALDLAKDEVTRRSLRKTPKEVGPVAKESAQSLHLAILGRSDVAKLLKDRPETDPCVADANGWTPLHLCCALGKSNELRLLLVQTKLVHPVLWRSGKENRPKPRVKEEAGVKSPRQWSPLGMEADVKKGGDEVAVNSLMGRTPSHLAARGDSEGKAGSHIACLEVLLEMGALDLELRDDEGMSPLLAAVSAGSLAGVEWLLRHGADCYAEDHLKRNALYIAAEKGPDAGDMVRFLCRWDADVSKLKAMRDWKGRRPQEVYLYSRGWSRRNAPGGDERMEHFATIWEAARSGDVSLLKLTLKEASPDDVSPGGWTPAMYAAKHGRIEVLRILLAMGCSCSAGGKPRRDLKIWRGDSPLHLAAEAGHAEVCSLLVRAGRASLQARNHAGLTPLHLSALHAKLPTLKMLMALKADPEELEKSKTPRNVFHMLAEDDVEHMACTQWLLNFMMSEAGASKLVKLLEYEATGLRRPADLLRQGRLRQVLMLSLRKARQRCEDPQVTHSEGLP